MIATRDCGNKQLKGPFSPSYSLDTQSKLIPASAIINVSAQLNVYLTCKLIWGHCFRGFLLEDVLHTFNTVFTVDYKTISIGVQKVLWMLHNVMSHVHHIVAVHLMYFEQPLPMDAFSEHVGGSHFSYRSLVCPWIYSLNKKGTQHITKWT